MRVAMDASLLMAPVETGVRVFDELDRLLGDCDLVVPEAVLDELRALARGQGDEARAASVGLDLADRCAPVATDESYADDALLGLARRGEVDAVATNDAPLRDRVLAAGVPVIHIRGRTQLTLTRP
jgi:rRNA-processing protein FCF1